MDKTTIFFKLKSHSDSRLSEHWGYHDCGSESNPGAGRMVSMSYRKKLYYCGDDSESSGSTIQSVSILRN